MVQGMNKGVKVILDVKVKCDCFATVVTKKIFSLSLENNSTADCDGKG